MNSRKIFLVFITLLALFQICFGQEKPEAKQIAEMGKICSEDLMARLDNFFIQLNNEPTALGYIIFHGGITEGRNLQLINYMTNFYPTRRFDKSRLLLLRGENREEECTQFWIVPAGATPIKPETEFTEIKYASTSLFDKSWANFNKTSGKLDIYENGFYDLGCDFSPNRNEFAKVLLSNPALTGYLLIYTEFGKSKKYGDKIAKFALNELTKQHKVPANQLKTIYGGNREQPEIEFWIVPKGEQSPTPKPDKKVK